MKDTLGDRQKFYENLNETRLMPCLPVLARVDGQGFHNFTKGMKRPYDETMSTMMINTMIRVAFETNALMAYTQSDEISFVYYSSNPKSQIWFDGRHSKMVSSLAAKTTLAFYQEVELYMSDYACRNPTFDARVWTVPNQEEAANAFLWRELDASKNSISMAARTMFSDKELFKKNGSEKQEMMFQKGVNWDKYPSFFKRGTFIQRKKVMRPFTFEEIEKLPAKHEARTNPNLQIERSEWVIVDMPKFGSVTNRVDVVFNGADPIVKTS